jgi:hypothetical protein
MKRNHLITKTITILLIAGAAQTMAEQRFAYGQPMEALALEPIEPTEENTLAELDIVSEQKDLGSGDTISVPEGKVIILHPQLFDEKITSPSGRRMIISDSERLYYIKFPFSLHPLPERRCKTLELRLRITTPQVSTLKLIPDSVVVPEDRSRSIDIGFLVADPSSRAKAEAKLSDKVSYPNLRPVIRSYWNNDNSRDFKWDFEGVDDKTPVEEGSKIVAATLKVPKTMREFQLTFIWKMEWQRLWLDMLRTIPVKVGEKTITVKLP